MIPEQFIVRCPHCGTKNRIPRRRWGEHALCANCKRALYVTGPFPDRSITVHDWDFRDQVLDFPGAVLMEFFSPS